MNVRVYNTGTKQYCSVLAITPGLKEISKKSAYMDNMIFFLLKINTVLFISYESLPEERGMEK